MSSPVVWDGESGAVYLEPPEDKCSGVSQPSVFKEEKLTGEDPVIRAEWEVKEFVWYSRFLDDLPVLYELLLERLDVDPDDYSCDINGFFRYRHRYDPNRDCDVESIYVPLVKVGKYHPYYSVKHRRRASARTLDRLEFLEAECRRRRVKFDYIVNIELTFPSWVSERWNDDDVQHRIREAVKDFLRELHGELFGDHKSEFGAICNHHYWSSKSPLSPHRHVHLTIPNVVYNRGDGTFHRFKPMIKGSLIRRVWKEALKENDLWGDTLGDLMPDIYVVYKKFENRNKVVHRLSYCSRKPIEDIVTQSLESGDFREIMENGNYDVDFAWFLLDYTPRVVNLGFLTNLKRFGYSRKSVPLKCPVCGGDMWLERDDYNNVILYDRPPPDIPSLYRDRSGRWCRLPSRNDPVGGD